MSFISTILVLFLIMDPLGSVSTFLNLMKDVDPAKRTRILFREMIIALAVMFLFYGIGDFLLDILQVSETTVRLSSGMILFLAALKILFPGKKGLRATLHMEGEPRIVPLAIPLIAGPSLLATIMLFAHSDVISPVLIPAILIAWCGALAIFWIAPFLQRALGTSGLMAIERLMGMVLVLLAIQRFLEGIQLFWALRA